jgi:hypothetical protein
MTVSYPRFRALVIISESEALKQLVLRSRAVRSPADAD